MYIDVLFEMFERKKERKKERYRCTADRIQYYNHFKIAGELPQPTPRDQNHRNEEEWQEQSEFLRGN